jgi:hypothetical protein
MAGYSNTPLARKLGIQPAARVALVNAPVGLPTLLGPLPPGAVFLDATGEEPSDVILFFVRGRAEVLASFGGLADRLARNGGLWVCWPKKASGVVTDLTEDVVRAIGLEAGLVDNRICAVDGTWSALRFVYRLRDRPPRRSAPGD